MNKEKHKLKGLRAINCNKNNNNTKNYKEEKGCKSRNVSKKIKLAARFLADYLDFSRGYKQPP